MTHASVSGVGAVTLLPTEAVFAHGQQNKTLSGEGKMLNATSRRRLLVRLSSADSRIER